MDSYRIQLANSAPDCDLIVRSDVAALNGTPAVVCTYRARDPWFGSAELQLDPATPDFRGPVSNTQTPPRGMEWAIPVDP